MIQSALGRYNHVLSKNKNYKPCLHDDNVNGDVFVGMNRKFSAEKTSKITKIEDFNKNGAFFSIRFQMVR